MVNMGRALLLPAYNEVIDPHTPNNPWGMKTFDSASKVTALLLIHFCSRRLVPLWAMGISTMPGPRVVLALLQNIELRWPHPR